MFASVVGFVFGRVGVQIVFDVRSDKTTRDRLFANGFGSEFRGGIIRHNCCYVNL